MEHYSDYQDRKITSATGTKGLGQSLSQSKPSVVQGDLSPIMERLSLIADEVAHAHANMTELERQLEPIIAHSPQDEGEAKANHEACDMEAKLVAIYNHVRGLNARMTIMRNDLRI